MKRLIVSLLIITAILLSACAEQTDVTSSSTPESDFFDISETSGFEKYPTVPNESVIDLPEGVSYSLEIDKNYRERLSQYVGITDNGKGIGCYAWLESGELKFGMKPLANIDTPEHIIKDLPAATLGEIRTLLYGYTPNRRMAMKLVVVNEQLLGYEDTLRYMLGIGENCIEYTVSFGDYEFDIAFGGSEANALYEVFQTADRSEAPLGQLDENCEDALRITIRFAPAGNKALRGMWGEWGSYTLYANGNAWYSPSPVMSYCERVRFSEEFYGSIYTHVLANLKDAGIKYPIASENELWCSARIGLHSQKAVITGDSASEMLALAKELSGKAEVCQDRVTDAADYEDAVYIEFYNGDMEIQSEFTVYSDDYCGLFMPAPFLSRKHGVLPNGSYETLCERINVLSIGEDIYELLTLLEKQGIKVSEPNGMQNVTPLSVSNETDYKIFRSIYDSSSYLVADGEAYVLCNYFGGFGFHNAVPCDFDKNGVKDLIGACTWGSGIHRGEIFFFDMNEKSSSVIYSTLGSEFTEGYEGWELAVDYENGQYLVKMYEITLISSKPPEYITLGEIVEKDGKPVFAAVE